MADDALSALRGERYLNLETFKRDGSGVKTPVWFAHVDDRLVIFTESKSYKVKRLRRNTKVRVAACGARGAIKGPWFEGTGTLVNDDPGREKVAYDALLAKYGWQMRLTNFASRVAGRINARKIIEVTF